MTQRHLRRIVQVSLVAVLLFCCGFFLATRTEASGNHTAEVTDWYWICHGRAPDSGGLNYWVGQLNSNDNHNAVFNSFVSAGGCPRPAPRCTSFSANPTAIFNPGSSTLSWSTQYGKDFGVSPNIGTISTPSGSRSVSPTSTQTYTFVVTNPNGVATCSATVTVRYQFTNNRPNVPGRFSWSNGTYCGSGTLLHDRAGWLSASGNTAQESTSVSAGQNTVGALLNLVGRACTAPDYSNADGADGGRVKNRSVDEDAIYVRGATISSSPQIAGLTTTLPGKTVSISRSGQYSTRPGSAWTSIGSTSFSVSGLGGITPGTYSITIVADVAYTSILNGSRVCSANQASASSTTGAECPSNSVNFTISITVPPGTANPPSPQCETFGPTPGTIRVGENSLLGWSVRDAADVQLLVNGVSTTVGHVVSGYSVSPTVTTQYLIVATDNEGEQVTCPMTVTVQNDPDDPDDPLFSCDASMYQSVAGVVFGQPFTELRRLEIADSGPSEYARVHSITAPNLTNINAIGYNIEDGYLYGVGTFVEGVVSRNSVVRVDRNGVAHELSVVSRDNPSLQFNIASVVGDFDSRGNLVIRDVNNQYVYTIDVSERTYQRHTMNPNLEMGNDWVHSGGAFYSLVPLTGNGSFTQRARLHIVRFDSNQNRWVAESKNIGGTVLPHSSAGFGEVYGAAWTNRSNKLYFGWNPGGVYEIEGYEQTNPTARFVLDTTAVNGNDGASCPNARDLFEKVNHPFIKVNGSDVVAGAVFAGLDDDVCEAPGAVSTSTWGTIRANGKKAHGYSTETDDILAGSSSAQYGAFSFGKVDTGLGSEASFITNNGYYRAKSSTDPTRRRDVLFANNGIGEYGYYYTQQSLPCIDVGPVNDESEPLSASAVQSTITNPSTGKKVYEVSGNVTLGALSVPTSNHVTVLVRGSVTVSGNITYQPLTVNGGILQSPSLTIIATGGIVVNSNVTQVAGYYIAYNSTLATCGSGVPTTQTCNQQLVVNGGLAGGTIEWRRNYGTLNSRANTLPNGLNNHCAVVDVAGDVAGVVGALNQCAAERVEFSPQYYFTNPFITESSQGGISGPPLDSTELPPIY